MASVQVVEDKCTVCDGEKDIVTAVVASVQDDFQNVVSRYGKYIVYGVAGLVAFRLFKAFSKKR